MCVLHTAAVKNALVRVDTFLTPRQIAIATALQTLVPIPEIISLIGYYEKPQWKEQIINTKRLCCPMAIERNGEYIVINTKNGILTLLCPETGNIIREIHVKNCLLASCIDVSPDSNLIAVKTFGINAIKIINSNTNALVFNLNHGERVSQIRFLPPNNTLISSNGEHKTINLWDTKTGDCLKSMPFPRRGLFTVTADGQLLATALSPPGLKSELEKNEWKSVKIWHAPTFKSIHTLKNITKGVSCMAFSPDNTQLATASYVREDLQSKEYYPICITNPRSGKQIQKLAHYALAVKAMAYSPNRLTQLLVTGAEDGTILLWNPLSGQPLNQIANHKSEIRFLAFSPNGTHILSKADIDGAIYISQVPLISIEEKKDQKKKRGCLIS